MFGKKKDAVSEWTKTGSFMHKPDRGWLHSEESLREGGVCYAVRYVGCIPVEKSMRTLQYDMRQQVTREAILKCCETAGYQFNKRKKAHKNISKILGDIPNMKFSGTNANMTVSATGIKISAIDTGRKIGYHDMQGISFASGGEKDFMDMVGYVAKDEVNGRACHVVDCGGGLAYDVINTIGQAFEIRYKMFLENPPQAMEVPGKFSEISIFEEAAEPQYNEIQDDDDDDCPEYADPRAEGPSGTKSESHEYKVPLPVPVGQTSSAGIYAPLQNRTTQPQSLSNYDIPRGNTGRSDFNIRDSLDFAAGAQYTSPHQGAPPGTAYYENPLAANKADFATPKRIDSLPRNIMDDPVPGFGASNGSHGANWATFSELPPPPPPMATHPENQPLKPPPKPVPYALSKVDSQKPKQDSIHDKEWYHGQISRAEAELLLEDEGDFLVRESKRQPGQYVLSGVRNNSKRHLLLVDPEGKVRTKDKEFESVSQLVSFHLLNKVPIISAGSEVLITNPVIKG